MTADTSIPGPKNKIKTVVSSRTAAMMKYCPPILFARYHISLEE
jgi:hypothetical protein